MTEAVGYSAPLTAMIITDRQLVEAFTTYQTSRAFSPNTVNRRRLSLTRFASHMAPNPRLTHINAATNIVCRRSREATLVAESPHSNPVRVVR